MLVVAQYRKLHIFIFSADPSSGFAFLRMTVISIHETSQKGLSS